MCEQGIQMWAQSTAYSLYYDTRVIIPSEYAIIAFTNYTIICGASKKKELLPSSVRPCSHILHAFIFDVLRCHNATPKPSLANGVRRSATTLRELILMSIKAWVSKTRQGSKVKGIDRVGVSRPWKGLEHYMFYRKMLVSWRRWLEKFQKEDQQTSDWRVDVERGRCVVDEEPTGN